MDTTCASCYLPHLCWIKLFFISFYIYVLIHFYLPLCLWSVRAPIPIYMTIAFKFPGICNFFYIFQIKLFFNLLYLCRHNIIFQHSKIDYILSKNRWGSRGHMSFTTWIPPVFHAACHISVVVSIYLRYFFLSQFNPEGTTLPHNTCYY